MKYKPKFEGKMLVFEFRKPIYGSFYGIWDRWIKLAKDKRMRMRVITPTGTQEFTSYKEWMKDAKRMDRFFKNPNVPMVFYGRSIENTYETH